MYGYENWNIQDLTLRGYYDTIKLVNEISVNFPELFIIGNYVKIRFKNRGSSCYFLEVKRSKILQKLNIHVLIFYVVFSAKTDLHNEYIFHFELTQFLNKIFY